MSPILINGSDGSDASWSWRSTWTAEPDCSTPAGSRAPPRALPAAAAYPLGRSSPDCLEAAHIDSPAEG